MKHFEDERTRETQYCFEMIAFLVEKKLSRDVQKKLIREQASKLHANEHQQLICISERTINRYRRGGLEMLKPKIRPVQGSLKAFPVDALEQAIEIGSQDPELSADSIIDILQNKGVAGAEQMRVSALNRRFPRLSKDSTSPKRSSHKRHRLWTVEGDKKSAAPIPATLEMRRCRDGNAAK